jgi:glutamate dehydrogenase/leucine dehydrogenase
MLASAKLAAAHIGLDLSGSSIAVEGFGKIGSAAALTFADAGAKVVAISTIRGGVYDAAGLDVSRLLELSEEVGDDVVNRYPARRISSNEVIGLNVDILLPCNGAWTINRANVHSVRSKIICPGANIPFTNEVEQILHEKRIFCVPDIVANSGAVFGGHVDSFFSQQRIQDTINGEVCSRLAEVIRRAEEEGVTLGRVAKEMCLQKFNSVKRRAGQRSLFQNRFVKSSAKMLPRRIKNLLAPIYLKRVLSPN